MDERGKHGFRTKSSMEFWGNNKKTGLLISFSRINLHELVKSLKWFLVLIHFSYKWKKIVCVTMGRSRKH